MIREIHDILYNGIGDYLMRPIIHLEEEDDCR